MSDKPELPKIIAVTTVHTLKYRGTSHKPGTPLELGETLALELEKSGAVKRTTVEKVAEPEAAADPAKPKVDLARKSRS